ncbi:LuxR family transcriptional regulator [Pseudarthrobacter sp. NamE2]|uniref:LuxR family transcriptional regulator n=1 Tax=Pseudarthrobacter sp. NamE2 TaxID=2576838 RepID=UPI0010FD0374|nr:LuxR family transcriptional regulator [Pseudarthrobacter sp. NamE2]TLM81380.1 LuxR family transcriptional regulator [Pseudarthrobacter sp. NamE2]
MRNLAKTILLALLLVTAPALTAGAASAAPPAAVPADTVQADRGSSGGVWVLTGNTPTPSPGDTASTGPANPGTGESAENESTRLDWTPWVIGAVAIVVLVLILVWRRRRNTTIVG